MEPNEFHSTRDIQPVLGRVVKPTTLTGGGKVYMINPARLINPEVEGADLQTEVDTDVTIPVHFVSAQGPSNGDYIVGIPLGPKLIASRRVDGLAHIKGRLTFEWPWIGWQTLPTPLGFTGIFAIQVANVVHAPAGTAPPQDFTTSGFVAGTYPPTYTGPWQPVIPFGTPASNTSLPAVPKYTWVDPNDFNQGVNYEFDHVTGLYALRFHRAAYNPAVHDNLDLQGGQTYDLGTDYMTVNPNWDLATSGLSLRSAYYWKSPQGTVEHVTFNASTQFGAVNLTWSASQGQGEWWSGLIDTYIGSDRWQFSVFLHDGARSINTYGRKAYGDIIVGCTGSKLVYDTFYLTNEVGYGSGVPHWHPHLWYSGVSMSGSTIATYVNDWSSTWDESVHSGNNVAILNIYDDMTLLGRPFNFRANVPIVLWDKYAGIGSWSYSADDAENPFGGPASVTITQGWKGWPAQVRWESWHPA
jgi:hypothetical protein